MPGEQDIIKNIAFGALVGAFVLPMLFESRSGSSSTRVQKSPSVAPPPESGKSDRELEVIRRIYEKRGFSDEGEYRRFLAKHYPELAIPELEDRHRAEILSRNYLVLSPEGKLRVAESLYHSSSTVLDAIHRTVRVPPLEVSERRRKDAKAYHAFYRAVLNRYGRKPQ